MNKNEGEKELFEWVKAEIELPLDMAETCLRYIDLYGSYFYYRGWYNEERKKFENENTRWTGISGIEWLRPLPKSKPIGITPEDVKRWFQILVGKGEEAMFEDIGAKHIDSEEIPDINELIKKFLPNQFELSSFKPKEVLRLEAAFQQGAQVMFHTLKNKMEESKNLADSEEIPTDLQILKISEDDMPNLPVTPGVKWREGFLAGWKKRGNKNLASLPDSEEIERMAEERWISVKGRLPDDQDEVLVYCKGIHKAMYLTDVNGFYFSGTGLRANKNLITHWQPLPKPPKNHS